MAERNALSALIPARPVVFFPLEVKSKCTASIIDGLTSNILSILSNSGVS